MDLQPSSVFAPKTSKKTLRVLSIDWDVFHDITQFMPGSMTPRVDWVVEYCWFEGEFKHLYKFAETEFQQAKEFLAKQTQPIYFADDHSSIYNLIDANTHVELTNLDFHSDMYPIRDKEGNKKPLDCGNWMLYLVVDKRCTVNVDWRQLHSKGDSGETEYTGITWTHALGFEGVFDKDYDLIFVCQSAEYSPPHKNHRFRELIDSCRGGRICEEKPPYYPSYTERVAFASEDKQVYIPTGNETQEEMDEIHDDHDNLVVTPDLTLVLTMPDCDPLYRK